MLPVGEHVPEELRQRRQWVAALITPDPQRPGKRIKRPVNPRTGGLASTTAPATWGAFEEAVRRAQAIERAGARGAGAATGGVGFVFTTGDPYVGIDFDGCIDEAGAPDAAGEVDGQVRDWLRLLDSYTEKSLSGKGLHVILRGQLPPSGRRKGPVEMYDRSRFFVMTGERVASLPGEINERTAELAQMHAAVFSAPQPLSDLVQGLHCVVKALGEDQANPTNQFERRAMPTSDDEVLHRALSAANWQAFEALWLGKPTKHPSPSEADFALACQLAFWTGGDLAQMDRIFRRSGRMRAKWDEKHYGDGRTYGEVTLANALAQTKEFYRGAHVGASSGSPVQDVEGSLSSPVQDVAGSTSPCEPKPAPTNDGEQRSASTDMPALPDGVLVDPALAEGASPWLEAFVAYARECLPWAYGEYAVAAGLHVLSTVAARRVLVQAGGKQFTNLYLLLVGPSSYAGKSRSARLALDVLDAAGLTFLRAPDQMTPQALIRRANDHQSPDWKKRANADKWALEKLKAAFAGKWGWFYDEFGSFIVQILNDNGPMQGFRPLLKEFDGCPERYESDTITRAAEVAESPYLTLLTAMTPGQFGKARRKFDELAEDGFWARFAFVAPPPGWTKPPVRAPKDLPPIPPGLLKELVAWHHRLGIPDMIETEPQPVEGDDPAAAAALPRAKGAKGSEAGELTVIRRPARQLHLDDEVYEAFNRYREALEALARTDGEEVAGNYGRHAERTLRAAALLASLQGDRLELRHWAYAQGIAERWRQGLHWALEAAGQSVLAPDVELELRVQRAIETTGGPITVRDVQRRLRNVGSRELTDLMTAMARAGTLTVAGNTRQGNPVYALA